MTLTTMLKKIAGVGWTMDAFGRIRTKEKWGGVDSRCLCPLESASLLILKAENPSYIGVSAVLGIRTPGSVIVAAADSLSPDRLEARPVRALMVKILKPEARKP